MSARKREIDVRADEKGKEAVSRAALVLLEPLIDICLGAGISSPEVEGLIRAAFVHRARQKLLSEGAGKRAASDSRISLTTGVHRNFVRDLLRKLPQLSTGNARKQHRAARLLNAWHSDPKYMDNSWHPRELPLRSPSGEASFAQLVGRFMPAVSVRVALNELQRAKVVQLLPDDRIRVLAKTFRHVGVDALGITETADRVRNLLDTMVFNMQLHPQQRVCLDTSAISVARSQLPTINNVIARRVSSFLQALDAEFRQLTPVGKRARRHKDARVGLTIYSWEK